MNVQDLMTPNPKTCSPDDSLDLAARIMWETDCGIVPVVDADGRAISVITDRDVCMAAFMQRRPLFEIPVSSAESRFLFSVRPYDSPRRAEELMRDKQVRRVLVTDDGGHLLGILSLNDLARHSGSRNDDLGTEEVTRTLAAICRPPSIAASSAH